MLIAAPNLCLDITIRLGRLVPGTVARSSATDTSAGSKGVNVARAAASIGARPLLAGFVPRDDGDRLVRLLEQEDLDLQQIPVDGALRIATILLEDSGRVTMVNGRGPRISAERWQQYAELVAQSVVGRRVLVCSGSLPPGMPTGSYRRLIEIGRLAGVGVIVDAAPDVLREALTAEPDLVSPNLSEAEGLLRDRTDGTAGQAVEELVDEQGEDIPDRAVEAAIALRARGAVRAVVTAGASGAALATSRGAWWLPALPVDVVNPIGAGDCFVAGAAAAMMSGAGDVDVVRHGMAVAAASCETGTAGRLDPARAVALYERSSAEHRPTAVTS